ncbi:MAG: zinc transporter ZupT [Planctomycetota bacterium]|jgi:ZIP family zinc transporter|nr:zinc transporter ZupT [Planctomycetota bacterium]
MDENALMAFAFTLLAGLSTGIGSAIAFFANRTNTRFLAVSLGFSAGVMLYVSFAELLNGARRELALLLEDAHRAEWCAVIAFFAGMAMIAVIDKLVPEVENPHELKKVEDLHSRAGCKAAVGEMRLPESAAQVRKNAKLMRMGTIAALVIGIHNFPEGLATFMSTIQNPNIGFSVAVAIAIHNIPEGIAVSVPIYYATGDRRKAFLWSSLSGLTEPLGALLGYLVLAHFMTPELSPLILVGVAGIMVYISLDELLPSAEKYGEHHLSIYGAVGGMAVMALSLLLLA